MQTLELSKNNRNQHSQCTSALRMNVELFVHFVVFISTFCYFIRCVTSKLSIHIMLDSKEKQLKICRQQTQNTEQNKTKAKILKY